MCPSTVRRRLVVAVLSLLIAVATIAPEAARAATGSRSARLLNYSAVTRASDPATFVFFLLENTGGASVPGPQGDVVLSRNGVEIARTPIVLQEYGYEARFTVSTLPPGVHTLRACGNTACADTVHIVYDTKIDGIYSMLLGRRVDPGGAAYFANRPLPEVVRAVVASRERQEGIVRGLYHTLLGREPDRGGLLYWADRVSRGYHVERLALDLCGCERREGDTYSLCSAYEEFLARHPSAEERSYWGGYAQETGQNPTGPIFGSAEGRAWAVRRAFRQALGRDPDANALTYWTQFVSGAVPTDPLLAGILLSAEYANR